MPKREKNPRDRVPASGGIEKYRAQTRSVTAEFRRGVQRRRKERARRAREALQEARERALASQRKAPKGTRGDGNFHLAFVQMGQGDCAIMSTPEGRTIMIDCGSDATETHKSQKDLYYAGIRSVLYGPKFLMDSDTLDYLIFTHPDSDHYNKLRNVLNDTTKIYKVFHSARIEQYSVGQMSAWVKNHVVDLGFIQAISINENGSSINTVAVDPDIRGTVQILNEEHCTVSVMCSNVSRDTRRDTSNNTNRGSLVTLIEAFGRKIIVCGDATRSTEHFLLNRYEGDLIKGVDIAQIPHHGSAVTSSSDSWVIKVSPTWAVASAGKNVDKHNLPSIIALGKYFIRMQGGVVPEHEVYSWDLDYSRYTPFSEFTDRSIYTTGSNSSQIIDISSDGILIGV